MTSARDSYNALLSGMKAKSGSIAAREKSEFEAICNNPKRILYKAWAKKFGNSRHKGGSFHLSDLYSDYKQFAHDN